MKTTLHRADDRGKGEHGWLSTRHSFSFANWYDPTRMGFGALRVLNDDTVAPKKGFGMHSHANFEIITIVLKGAVTHEDSLGNQETVRAGEVQTMSAGTGVTHSEINREDDPLELFQLWIEPNKQNISPRYAQRKFDTAGRRGKWQMLVSGGNVSGTLPIHQDVRIARAELETGKTLDYQLSSGEHGVYLFVIGGKIETAGEILERRDAIGIRDVKTISIKALSPASLLLIEVPLA